VALWGCCGYASILQQQQWQSYCCQDLRLSGLIWRWSDQGTEIAAALRNPWQCVLGRALQQQHQQQMSAALLQLLLLLVALLCQVPSYFPALRSPKILLDPTCLSKRHLLTAAAAALLPALAAPHPPLLLLLLP
jgi:hypothetical protein